MAVGAEVVPASLVLRQIGRPLGDVWLRDGTHEERASEHIFILLAQRLGIVAEVEDQRAHQRASIESDTRRITVDVWQQAVTLTQTLTNDRLCLVAIAPRFGVAHIAMHTHQGQIDAGLNPAQHPTDIVLVAVLIARAEETACIVGPPRHACGLHTEPRNDLSAEGFPVVAHVATPHRRAITLNARESATGENHGTTLGGILPQSLVDGLVDQQRIDVAHLFATPFPVVYPPTGQVVVLRLRGILPPGINA